jgi:hypothetical protein
MPIGPAIPALMSGLFGLGSNIATNIGAKRRERDARKFNERMEKDRRAYDTKQWERLMAYNHPTEQMARLTQAGLNPNLIYGSSPGSAVGNVSQSPTGKAVTGQAPAYKIDNAMVPFMNAKVQQAQANNMNTAAMKNVAQSNLSDAQTRKLQGTLSSDITIAEEGAKQAKTKTYMDRLQSIAASIPGKGLIAKSMAEVDQAILGRDKQALEIAVSKLNSDLAKRGIKTNDPLATRVMATLLDIDLSKPLTKKHAKAIKEFMKDPWNKLYDIITLK